MCKYIYLYYVYIHSCIYWYIYVYIKYVCVYYIYVFIQTWKLWGWGGVGGGTYVVAHPHYPRHQIKAKDNQTQRITKKTNVQAETIEASEHKRFIYRIYIYIMFIYICIYILTSPGSRLSGDYRFWVKYPPVQTTPPC